MKKRFLIQYLPVLWLLLYSMIYAESDNNLSRYRLPPYITNDMNVSAYDWNALNTRYVNMRALVMVAIDGAHFYQNAKSREHVGDMRKYNRFDVRGVRIGMGGTINFDRPWVYLVSGALNSLQQDYDSDTMHPWTLYDAELGIPMWGKYGRMQIGKMKEPISMERSMGLVFEQVMERPMHIDAFTPTRNIGISLSDALFNERLQWRAGFFNHWLDKSHLNFEDANRQFIARVTTVAWEKPLQEKLLHLGVSWRYEDVKEGSVRYDVGPEFYFSPPWLDTGEIEADSTDTVNLELSYLDGPFWFAAEYTHVDVESSLHDDPSFWGYHVALNYFVTGEHRGYNKRRGVVRRINPFLAVPEGGWGALEVSARYSYLNLDSRDIEGGKMGIVSLGLVWHPRKQHQFHLQWSHANCDGGGGPEIDPAGESHTNILQFRWVVVID